ncbi:MAG: ATP-binding cassette domain-containing protein, partial [Pseudomonadota bacterium]|nr:ATP-binding cassette domain-containing protein [Pseudomonadota bacterium]
MPKPLLEVRNLCKSFGGVTATDHLDLSLQPGFIHAVIGPNGAGKTTMIAQLSGALRPDSGKILFDGRDITSLSSPARSHLGIARTFQITSIFHEFTALENVALAVQAHDSHSFHFWRPVKKD